MGVPGEGGGGVSHTPGQNEVGQIINVSWAKRWGK